MKQFIPEYIKEYQLLIYKLSLNIYHMSVLPAQQSQSIDASQAEILYFIIMSHPDLYAYDFCSFKEFL